ncbi:YggS family pyridoxal phosphate-dependent enzyme [Pseudidiomarina aestuarii]|uniref:Pyridoxal phosphate homeostasis protein n=1 Tax=Pseudidiomarina aestuarii TaxID=624146 RepID=A0A2T4CUB8_9GAMM|nr:YggS family pyridoxal phosphate-dependent enzyme [Pseudidiomarina aestuarii]PTB88553.1 YggS family pyridoxal phosphate-dependent enzyme [Pseudidiomarina aestuarii]
MNSIAEQLNEVRKQISAAASAAQREASDITLIAVSKTKPITAIEDAYAAGQRHFGENYVQEAVDKAAELKQFDDIVWHFIGPLQSNKTAAVAETADWVHSVDREKIARRLAQQRPATKPPLNVLIQVNIDAEDTKSGVAPDAVNELAAFIAQQPELQLRGLMAIPAAAASSAARKTSFQAMQGLYSQLQTQYPTVDTLSMGMSDDLDLAILHGATMVRIGTAIFGARAR